MALTTSTGLIVPEVWGNAVMAAINGRLVFAQFATIFRELQGSPGDVLNLVEFARLADITADADESTDLVPEQLTSSDTGITIREAAKAVEITRRAGLTAFGNPIDIAIAESARTIRKRVDTVLRDAAVTAAGALTPTGAAMDGATIDAALLDNFGDRAFGGEETFAIVMHSQQYADFKSDADFEAATDRSVPGYAGLYDGRVHVIVSDLAPVTAGTPDTYTALLFAGKPLAYAHKRDIEVLQELKALSRSNIVVSTLHYAGGVMTAGDIVGIETQ